MSVRLLMKCELSILGNNCIQYRNIRKMTTFNMILVRHGETDDNALYKVQGHLDSKLSLVGRKQSEAVAERLKNEVISHAYSSDLSRAMDTANEIVSKNISQCKLVAEPLLRERSWGVFQGKSYAELKVAKGTKTIEEFTPEGAESMKQFSQRSKTFLSQLCVKFTTTETKTVHKAMSDHDRNKMLEDKKETTTGSDSTLEQHNDDTNKNVVLVVTHGGFIRELIQHLRAEFNCKFPENKDRHPLSISPNTGVCKFSITHPVPGKSSSRRKEAVCTLLHDAQHLTDAALVPRSTSVYNAV